MSAPPPSIATTLQHAVGGTPTLRLHDAIAPSAQVHLKLEHHNPGASAADRIALGLIERAEREGRLAPGGTVVEATLGSTGISLAQACAATGHRLVVCMPESMSLERVATLRAWGVKLELTPADAHIEGAKARARELAAALPGALVLPQWDVEAVAAEHEAGLGGELVESVKANGGRIDAFIAAVGTGGTLAGVGRALKGAFPHVRIFAALPHKDGPHPMQGLLAREQALALARAHADEWVDVDPSAAWQMKERLSREEGILVGVSTGAVVCAAAQIAERLGAGASIYAIAWDSGERYFSLAGRFS